MTVHSMQPVPTGSTADAPQVAAAAVPPHAPTRALQPLILIRGFGGLSVSDEKQIPYQGFNDGTVYPGKRGENYIYEGLLLRFMKSNWQYQDATNVVGYYGSHVTVSTPLPPEMDALTDSGFFHGDKIVIDPAMALSLINQENNDPYRTIWVLRYYDLDERSFATYGQALVRLIAFIRALTALRDCAAKNRQQGITKPPTKEQIEAAAKPKVNIIAHSMGGLIVRQAVQKTYPELKKRADEHINKIVTLGTPHRGISFQVLKDWLGDAGEELTRFNPDLQNQQFNDDGSENTVSYKNFGKHFPVERLLTVVGTNYRSYAITPSSFLNRMFSAPGEFGPNYNRSDGLVKQISAQIPGAPRTFVHKCHGGTDSLVTARESFEVATRFFFGNVRVRLRLLKGEITRGKDLFGKSEFFFGVSIKPRAVDFDLFHQSAEAENCYGPFSKTNTKKAVDFRESSADLAFPWAEEASPGSPGRLIWEGWLNTQPILDDKTRKIKDMVFRLDFYVGERDMFGIGFSDNVVFRKQYYIRAVLDPLTATPPGPPQYYLHTDESFAAPGFVPRPEEQLPVQENGVPAFEVGGTGFEGTFALEVDGVPLISPA